MELSSLILRGYGGLALLHLHHAEGGLQAADWREWEDPHPALQGHMLPVGLNTTIKNQVGMWWAEPT